MLKYIWPRTHIQRWQARRFLCEYTIHFWDSVHLVLKAPFCLIIKLFMLSGPGQFVCSLGGLGLGRRDMWGGGRHGGMGEEWREYMLASIRLLRQTSDLRHVTTCLILRARYKSRLERHTVLVVQPPEGHKIPLKGTVSQDFYINFK